MTTPAVNRNATHTSQGTVRITELDQGRVVSGPFTSPSSSYVDLWDKESRPASSPVSFIFPNFRGCKPWVHSGLLLSRAPEKVSVRTTLPSGHVVLKEYNGGFWTGFNPSGPLAFPSRLISQAEIKALEKLKAQNVHLGNFLATSGDTLNLVAGAMRSISASVRRFRRGNLRSVWNDIRRYEGSSRPSRRVKVSHAWLQLQYGWLPLMSDVQGALNEVYNKASRAPLFKVSSVAESNDKVTTSYASSQLSGCSCDINTVTKSSCHISLWYKLSNANLAEISSLGLVNPAEIIWECLPYSFVVDWFSPISSWLAALTADIGYSFISGSQTRVQKYKYEQGKIVFGTNAAIAASGQGIILAGEGGYSMNRTCYLSSPVPGLYVKNPLSLRHVLNASALLSQAFRG